MYIISELVRYHSSELQLAEPRAPLVPSPRLENLTCYLNDCTDFVKYVGCFQGIGMSISSTFIQEMSIF
jgi:hypothetical protein